MSNNRYTTVLEEIETDNLKKEVWLEAFEKARGDHGKAVSIYISLRGDQIYREQTSFYKRAAKSTFHFLDLRTKRGQLIAALITVTAFVVIPLAVQPALHNSASKKYLSLCETARKAHVVGENAQFLYKTLGEPTRSEINGQALVYVYNPSSFLCFKSQKYDLRFFVDNRTGEISEMQQSPLFVMGN